MIVTKRKMKEIENIKQMQKQSMEEMKEDYMVGLYNGIELILSLLQNRNPEYETCSHEPEIIEREEEQAGRTVASGMRRR